MLYLYLAVRLQYFLVRLARLKLQRFIASCLYPMKNIVEKRPVQLEDFKLKPAQHYYTRRNKQLISLSQIHLLITKQRLNVL